MNQTPQNQLNRNLTMLKPLMRVHTYYDSKVETVIRAKLSLLEPALHSALIGAHGGVPSPWGGIDLTLLNSLLKTGYSSIMQSMYDSNPFIDLISKIPAKPGTPKTPKKAKK